MAMVFKVSGADTLDLWVNPEDVSAVQSIFPADRSVQSWGTF